MIAATDLARHVRMFDRYQAARRGQEPGEYTSRALVQVRLRAGNSRHDKCLSQIGFMKHRPWPESVRTTKDFPNPIKMKAKWMPQMTLLCQPNGKRRQLGAKPGILVSLMVPRKQIN